MRPGTYYRHASGKRIEELGQFVDIGPSQKPAQTGIAGIVTCYLPAVGVIVYAQASEFITTKREVVFS